MRNLYFSVKSAEKLLSIASAIISPERSAEGEKLSFRDTALGCLGCNFLHIFIHFYHSANFKMIYAKDSSLVLAIHTLEAGHFSLQSR